MHSTTRPTTWLAGAAIAVSLTAALPVHSAEPRLAATYTARTANMTPANLGLRIQVIAWQEAAARADAVATLAAGADADPPLAKLPTVGYVWPAASPVGYSLKYAHRTPQPGGGERVTLVTDRRLGSYDFKPWSAPGAATANEATYSVVELYLDESGAGTGNLSLAAEVALDADAGTVSLVSGAGQGPLLADVKREPARQ